MHPYYYAVFCLVVFSGVLVSGCGMLLKDPRITLSHVAIRSVSLQEIGLDVTLTVDNPNPVGISLKTLVFDVHYQKGTDWVYISHGEGAGITVAPDMNEVTIPVSIKTAELPGVGLGALVQREITLRISGTATPDFVLFAPQIPFNQTVTVPLGT